jgi:hypothetical protein
MAFSLLRVDANGCERTLAHEMGHNLRLHHDWRTYKTERSAGDSIGTDNHGFVSVPGDFATVMATNDPDCGGGLCERIPYWSNADVSIRGHAAGKRGISESEEPAESYRTIGSTGPTIAKFRATAATPLAQAPYWAGWDIAADLHLRTDGAGGYTLDGYGGIHDRSGAPAAAGTPPYWPNLHIARGLSLIGGTASGVTLDGYGGLHKWDRRRTASPPRTPLTPPGPTSREPSLSCPTGRGHPSRPRSRPKGPLLTTGASP